MLSCSIMKNRAILDQIARITYIANDDRVAPFRGMVPGVRRAPPPKKGADDSIVGRMVLKNLREDIEATCRRLPAARAHLAVVHCALCFHPIFVRRRQQCG
jgi:hypothetical protein